MSTGQVLADSEETSSEHDALLVALRVARQAILELSRTGLDAEQIALLKRADGGVLYALRGLDGVQRLRPRVKLSGCHVWVLLDTADAPPWWAPKLEEWGTRVTFGDREGASSASGQVVIVYDPVVDPEAPVWAQRARQPGEPALCFVGVGGPSLALPPDPRVIRVAADVGPEPLRVAMERALGSLSGPPAGVVLSPPVGRQELVMVVESDLRRRIIAEQLLRHLGFSVRTAATVQQARQQLTTERVRLMLLDMALLKGEARDELFALRVDESNRREPPVPVVAMLDPDMTLPFMRSSGFTSHYVRPLDAESLAVVLERHLDRRPMILIADDDHAERGRLVDTLHQFGEAHVVSCDRLEGVFELARRWHPDVVLVSTEVCHGGWELVSRQLSAVDVPVVALSGDESEELVHRSIEAGCCELIKRPFDRATLWRVLHAHMVPWHFFQSPAPRPVPAPGRLTPKTVALPSLRSAESSELAPRLSPPRRGGP